LSKSDKGEVVAATASPANYMRVESYEMPEDDFSLSGKSILITGGTGTFGRAFVEKVLSEHVPRRLVVLSRDEFKQYEMAQQFNGPNVRYLIGDVRDGARVEAAMRDIDFVIHAAAMKHMPIAEQNPFECVSTNVVGAEMIVRAALRTGVKKVIAVSTDKAVYPTNLYGASKLCSDSIFLMANNLAGAGGTRFAVVRYGNVVGSRGSVIPFFKAMIDKGANHLPITAEAMTRFWITIQGAIDFVLGCLKRMRGGELFVPKIPSMRIVDLARAMAPHLPTKVIGQRHGEKLHEFLITNEEARYAIDAGEFYVLAPQASLFDHYLATGRRVPENFSYRSDNNPLWLDTGDMKRLLEKLPA
jgi:UDP-N-acetylglucosamine 4,6-dehydratase